jgi:hypothetical protein
MIKEAQATDAVLPSLVIVLNWHEDRNRLVPTKVISCSTSGPSFISTTGTVSI